MSKILFTLSSPIIRNNGIITFIRETTQILREAGHTVDFLTDNTPELDIASYFDNYFQPEDQYEYPVIMKDGMPDIKYLPHISNRIRDVWNLIDNKSYDVIISNDAQCTAGLIDTGKCIHYIHTAALIDDVNLTCLNDSYIQFERDLLPLCKAVAYQTQQVADLVNEPGTTDLILGLTLNDYMSYTKQPNDPSEGIMFVGEGSLRKGADLYKENTKHFNVPLKLVLSAEPEVQFGEGFDKRTFVDDNEGKQKFIRSSKISYFPSRSEVMAYGVLETLLSQPVIVHEEYDWTKSIIPLGAIRADEENAAYIIKEQLDTEKEYDPSKIINYFEKSKQDWIDFADSLENS